MRWRAGRIILYWPMILHKNVLTGLRGLGYNHWGPLTHIGDCLQRLAPGPVTGRMTEYALYGVFWYFEPI